MRSLVKAASVVPKLAFSFILRVEAKTKDDAEERLLEQELDVPPPEMETLDAKIGAAVDCIAKGTTASDLAILTDKCIADTGGDLSGRRKLRVLYNAYRTNQRRGGLYSIADLQAVRLSEDNLEKLLPLWEQTMLELAEKQSISNLQDLFYD